MKLTNIDIYVKNRKYVDKLGLSCAKLTGARSLAELQLRIHWHKGMDEMQNKACFSGLPTS